jgi:hypothetical protein
LIDEFRKHPEFQKAMAEIKKRHRPEPKIFHPANPVAVDEWKYDSGFIAGFDLLYSILTEGKK